MPVFAYGKNQKFYGKKLQLRKETPVYYTFQKQTFAGAYKLDVFKDFAKFTGKPVYRSLYLMKLQASILTLQVKYVTMCPDIAIKTSIGYQLRKYWWLDANLENGFGCWDNFGNHHPVKLVRISRISEICNENICGGVSL